MFAKRMLALFVAVFCFAALLYPALASDGGQETETLEFGELGIFILDGNGYFKIYGGDRLISMNKIYGDILLKDFENVSCVGRVVGKLKRK
jgi:hypothetical protein